MSKTGLSMMLNALGIDPQKMLTDALPQLQAQFGPTLIDAKRRADNLQAQLDRIETNQQEILDLLKGRKSEPVFLEVINGRSN
jgi:hypothetical protein